MFKPIIFLWTLAIWLIGFLTVVAMCFIVAILVLLPGILASEGKLLYLLLYPLFFAAIIGSRK